MNTVLWIVGGCVAAAVIGVIVYMARIDEKDIDDDLRKADELKGDSINYHRKK